MAYVTTNDYTLLIQDVNLQQIISSNVAIREQAELMAAGEARSYLIQKYKFDEELSKTTTARDPQLLNYIIDMVIYHLHSRISPRNIPELRTTRYENAIDWLKMCAKGDCTPKLEIQTTGGRAIRWGSQSKNQNNF